MSYDIFFRVKVEGIDRYLSVGECNANITWNVKELIRQSSGWHIKNEEYNGFVKDLIPHIRKGLSRLEVYPEPYKKFESPNGWGTICGVIRFYKEIIWAWERLYEEDSELANIALIYVC